MYSWTPGWQRVIVHMTGLGPSADLEEIIAAWGKSTPISPHSNNPLGMPAGTSGAKPYAGTQYARFDSMTEFYDAFGTWLDTQDGRNVMRSLASICAAIHMHKTISELGWPASATETDYPAALLDMCPAEYQADAASAEPQNRRTSGLVIDQHAAQAFTFDISAPISATIPVTFTSHAVTIGPHRTGLVHD